MDRLNELSFERLPLVAEYIRLSTRLENYIDAVRLNISKARTLRGVGLSSVFQIDSNDMEPTMRVCVEDDIFSLIEIQHGNDDKSEERKEVRKRFKDSTTVNEIAETEEEEKNIKIPHFRPFGVLEPLPAKQARNSIGKALEVICELATLQAHIKRIDKEMIELKEDVMKDLVHIKEHLDVLSI